MVKSLADKFLNGLKKTAIIGLTALAPYISSGQDNKGGKTNAELYQVPQFAKLQTESGEIELGGPKFYNVKYISKPLEKDALGFELYPFVKDAVEWTTDGKKLTSFEPKVVYVGKEMNKSQILLKSSDESPFGVDGNKGEAIEKGDLVGGNFTFDLGEMSKNLRAAVFPNGDTLYYSYLDHKTDSTVLSGEKAQFVFLKKVKGTPLMTSDSDGNLYLNGKIYEVVVDKSRSDLEALTDSTENGVINMVYDSCYLESNEDKIKEIVKNQGTPGHVKEFLGESAPKEEKEKKSYGDGRLMIDVQAGKTFGLDDNEMAVNNGRVSLQYKLWDGTSIGFFAGASNSTYHNNQTTENPGQDSLINPIANLYRKIDSKTDVADEISMDYELGAMASFLNKSGSLRFDLGASVLAEKRKQTIQTSGNLKIMQGEEELNSASFSSQPITNYEHKPAFESGARVSAGVYLYPAKLLGSKSRALNGLNLGVSGQYTLSGFNNYKYPSATANVGYTYSFGGSKKSGGAEKSEEGK